MKTNKQEQIKILTRKYFWKQKFIEICIIVTSLIVFYFLSYFGSWVDGKYFEGCNGLCVMNTFWEHIPFSLLSVLILGWFGVVLLIIGGLIYFWIDTNWTKAKRKAKRKLKIK